MKKLVLALALAPTLAFAQTPPPPPPTMIDVSFTKDEATVLLQMLDAAVKSCGLPCASNAAVLANKVQAAAQKAQ